ncbi:hypothetical protein GF362_03235 [Candidatus Dojkabacteria bacterium]|nr:hypothetical protein [Candidatus Dojkabacteria bacterium]
METVTGKSGNTSGGTFTDPHNHYTYTGQEWDDHLNMYEFYARAYDPYTGVWMRQDNYRGEIRNPMSLHRYMYVKNSPVNYIDMYGYTSGYYIGWDDYKEDWHEFLDDVENQNPQSYREYHDLISSNGGQYKEFSKVNPCAGKTLFDVYSDVSKEYSFKSGKFLSH